MPELLEGPSSSDRPPSLAEALQARLRRVQGRGPAKTFDAAKKEAAGRRSMKTAAVNPKPGADIDTSLEKSLQDDVSDVLHLDAQVGPPFAGVPERSVTCDGNPKQWPGYGRCFLQEEIQLIQSWGDLLQTAGHYLRAASDPRAESGEDQSCT